jgi:hypothetical protein
VAAGAVVAAGVEAAARASGTAAALVGGMGECCPHRLRPLQHLVVAWMLWPLANTLIDPSLELS